MKDPDFKEPGSSDLVEKWFEAWHGLKNGQNMNIEDVCLGNAKYFHTACAKIMCSPSTLHCLNGTNDAVSDASERQDRIHKYTAERHLQSWVCVTS